MQCFIADGELCLWLGIATTWKISIKVMTFSLLVSACCRTLTSHESSLAGSVELRNNHLPCQNVMQTSWNKVISSNTPVLSIIHSLIYSSINPSINIAQWRAEGGADGPGHPTWGASKGPVFVKKCR